jgi:two-component system response regulator PilR (NtrC family)
MSKPLALVIDDEPDIRELLSLTLGRMDIDTAVAGDVESAKAQLTDKRFDICLTDMRLPDGDGLELVEWMQKNSSGVPVAVITAHGNVETAVQALKLGAFDFISKPLDLKNLRNVVRNALKLDRERATEASQLLGDSSAMRELRDLVDRVARSQAPVHISGDSGTGKELVARLIHDSGPRGDGPFVPVNCGAIPAELVESEFFGHKKGSFTGAVRDKVGLGNSRPAPRHAGQAAARHPGADDKAGRGIGGTGGRRANPLGDPQEPLGNGSKRRLSRGSLLPHQREHVPSLRERGDDIFVLADHILKRLGSSIDVLDASARTALRNHHFPGNVRELENMLERAVTLCASGGISESDLALKPGSALNADDNTAAATNLGDQVEDVQRQAIVDALEKTRYNKTAAAKLLGLTFRQLRYRIKKLGSSASTDNICQFLTVNDWICPLWLPAPAPVSGRQFLEIPIKQ